MSVSSVTSTTTAAVQNARPDPMANVAKLLDMSPSDLRAALKSGSSLSDVASKQGVSRDDLLQQIESDLKNRPQRADGASGTSAAGGSADVDPAAEAAKIADTKGLPQHHGGHHRHGGGSGGVGGLAPATTSTSVLSSQLDSGNGVSVLL